MKNIFQNQIDVGMLVCESILKDNVLPEKLSNDTVNDHYMVTLDNHKYARKVTPEYVYDFVYGMYPRIHALHLKTVVKVEEIKHVNVSVEMLESIIDRGLNKVVGKLGMAVANVEAAVKKEHVAKEPIDKHRVLVVGFKPEQEQAIALNKYPRIKFRFISFTALAELKQAGQFDAVVVSKFVDHAHWHLARKKSAVAYFCSSPNEARSKIQEYLASLK